MMTNEQAIDWLIAIKEKYIHGGDEGFDELRKEALDVAIKALKVDLWQLRQEATENALKKAEVLYKRPPMDAEKIVFCKDCRHRDPEDKKCDCGCLERQGCFFPVADDYFCKFGARRYSEKREAKKND